MEASITVAWYSPFWDAVDWFFSKTRWPLLTVTPSMVRDVLAKVMVAVEAASTAGLADTSEKVNAVTLMVVTAASKANVLPPLTPLTVPEVTLAR